MALQPMRYALMTEPQQGLSYDEILAIARSAEEAGFEAFFRSDHYASFPGPEGMTTTDAWATLGGLARETRRIRLGTLVSPVTFRHPGSLAKVIQTVDEMSGGRVEAGFGSGWNEDEHQQLGIPFPPLAERYDMLTEQMEIIHGLWTQGDGWSFQGRHWQVGGSRWHGEIARGGRRHPHIIMGGQGKARLADLVARFADEFNLSPAAPEDVAVANARIDDACRAIGRDPDQVVRSAMVGVMVAETDRELQDRVRTLLESFGEADDSGQAWIRARRARWIMGTPDQALERARDYQQRGVQRIMLQDFLPRDHDMVRLAGRLFAA